MKSRKYFILSLLLFFCCLYGCRESVAENSGITEQTPTFYHGKCMTLIPCREKTGLMVESISAGVPQVTSVHTQQGGNNIQYWKRNISFKGITGCGTHSAALPFYIHMHLHATSCVIYIFKVIRI